MPCPNCPRLPKRVCPTTPPPAGTGCSPPAGTRAGVIQRLNSELAKVIALPELRQKLAADGAEPAGASAESFQKHIAAEIAKWARVVRAAGIRVE